MVLPVWRISCACPFVSGICGVLYLAVCFTAVSRTKDPRPGILEIIPLSAFSGENKDSLLEAIYKLLPEGPCYYPSDEITDKSERYMISEIIREKALMLLDDEIPHGIGVEISNMFYDEYGTAHIFVDVIAEKDSHRL